MSKRLVITGLPCPPQPWEAFLAGDLPVLVLPLAEVLEHTDGHDFRHMADYVAERIEEEAPSSIVCHDFGVPLTLLALLRLARKGKSPGAKVTIFNGAFRKVEVYKTTLPYRLHFMSYSRALKEVESAGGKLDPRLRPHMKRIRGIYRTLIAYSVAEKIQRFLGFEDIGGFSGKSLLQLPIQIIASENDPYIPLDSVEQIRRDFGAQRLVRLKYGHFPYSLPKAEILPFIEEFESMAGATA